MLCNMLFQKNPGLAWRSEEPPSYMAVRGLYAFGNGTSKQMFLFDCYSICETAADGSTGTFHCSTV